MKFTTALQLLQKEYDRACKAEFVQDPVAYALYQVWQKADADAQKKIERRKQKEFE